MTFAKGIGLTFGKGMTKRLRGVEVEQERLHPVRTFEKRSASQLAIALLSLWAHGKLAATTIRWLAECATLDGCDHEEICEIARAGSVGNFLAM